MKRKGFTLIELLIVIAIIGVLSAALYPTIRDALARGRDGARAGDINNIATVLETYNSDYGQYPPGSGCFDETSDAFFTPPDPGETNTLWADYFKGGKPPKDPSPTRTIDAIVTTNMPELAGCAAAGQFYYENFNGDDGVEYIIGAVMESAQNNNYPGDTPFNTATYNPGDEGDYYVHVF